MIASIYARKSTEQDGVSEDILNGREDDMARRGDALYLRGKTWWLDFRHNGTRHAVRLGKYISRSVAKELASVTRGAILKGEAGIGNKRKDCTFDKAKDAFLQWTETNKRPRTVRVYRQALERLAVSFSGKPLSRISPFDIERHKRLRAEAGARVRANREVAMLKSPFNKAKAWGFFEGENPALGIKFLEEPKRRLRYLECGEEARLLGVRANHCIASSSSGPIPAFGLARRP